MEPSVFSFLDCISKKSIARRSGHDHLIFYGRLGWKWRGGISGNALHASTAYLHYVFRQAYGRKRITAAVEGKPGDLSGLFLEIGCSGHAIEKKTTAKKRKKFSSAHFTRALRYSQTIELEKMLRQ